MTTERENFDDHVAACLSACQGAADPQPGELAQLRERVLALPFHEAHTREIKRERAALRGALAAMHRAFGRVDRAREIGGEDFDAALEDLRVALKTADEWT